MSCIGNGHGGKSDITLEGNLTVWRLVVLSRPAWLDVILLRDMFGWRIYICWFFEVYLFTDTTGCLEYYYLVWKFKDYESLLLRICENSVCMIYIPMYKLPRAEHFSTPLNA